MDNFSSAELLDQLLVVVSSRAWVLLVIIASALLAATIWGFAGSIPTQINGMGIIIERDAPLRIANANATGAVLEIKVNPGDIVEAGGEIATIGSPTTDTQLVQAENQLRILLEQNKIEEQAEQDALRKLKASLDLHRTATETSLKSTQDLLKMYKEQVEIYKNLSEQKLIARTQFIQAQSTLFSTIENEKNLLANIAGFDHQLQSQLAQIAQAQASRANQVANARASLNQAKSDRELNTVITAPMRCRIVNILTTTGNFVTPGQDFATVVPIHPASTDSNAALQAIGFVDYGKGKEVREGMNVQVAIPFAKSTEYGFIKGKVTEISSFASDSAMVTQAVGSETLSQLIVNATGGVPLMLSIELQADPNTPSGFAWTSAKGFPGKIPQLSECTMKITTHEEKPIDLVLPWFKEILGIDAAPDVPGTA